MTVCDFQSAASNATRHLLRLYLLKRNWFTSFQELLHLLWDWNVFDCGCSLAWCGRLQHQLESSECCSA